MYCFIAVDSETEWVLRKGRNRILLNDGISSLAHTYLLLEYSRRHIFCLCTGVVKNGCFRRWRGGKWESGMTTRVRIEPKKDVEILCSYVMSSDSFASVPVKQTSGCKFQL